VQHVYQTQLSAPCHAAPARYVTQYDNAPAFFANAAPVVRRGSFLAAAAAAAAPVPVPAPVPVNYTTLSQYGHGSLCHSMAMDHATLSQYGHAQAMDHGATIVRRDL
jgi:hypothetical protein